MGWAPHAVFYWYGISLSWGFPIPSPIRLALHISGHAPIMIGIGMAGGDESYPVGRKLSQTAPARVSGHPFCETLLSHTLLDDSGSGSPEDFLACFLGDLGTPGTLKLADVPL